MPSPPHDAPHSLCRGFAGSGDVPRVSSSFHSFSSFFSVPSRRRERVEGGAHPPPHTPCPPHRPSPPHPTQPQRVRAGPRGCRGSAASGGPDPSLMGPQRPRASTQQRGAASTLPPEPPPPIPSRPDPRAREQGGAIRVYIRGCMYIHICNARFPVLPKKALSQPVPTPCALISGTAPRSGPAPRFPIRPTCR